MTIYGLNEFYEGYIAQHRRSIEDEPEGEQVSMGIVTGAAMIAQAIDTLAEAIEKSSKEKEKDDG